ncbi:FAD-dependent oxidoreductase [Nocardiopsis sp. CC223A]|uniref:FAD-dependent oxidoreductase n=1 Tax=Nocardiopsis sp. CC223A TaxID=3044051 RepID=UPI00278C1615|nr:FAD-dependent oxidoreductase [Nocardiopsis sp. CC223A]
MTSPDDPRAEEEPAPLKVAVIGSGPAGLYTADSLTRQRRVPVRVDVIDRLHTPYGLVRYGVAPDHTKIKGVARALRRILEHPGVRFVGGVEFGVDVTRDDLARTHNAVVYATGAATDRHMGVPGEDLPGSVAATDFVNWYCGHPDSEMLRFVLDSEEVVVVGAGNVALDVARILVKTADELRHTDIPQPVLEALAASRVRTVHLLARRGPLQARFTAPELRDLLELPDVDLVVDPAQVDIDLTRIRGEVARAARTNLRLLRERAALPPKGHPRAVHLHFWSRPREILGADRVTGVRVERTRLDGEHLVGTGETVDLPAGMVLRSVGYAGVPIPGVPFDEASRTVPHRDGRVLDTRGRVVPGDYVAGWAKRGATGVIGTNKSDAAATVRSLLDDAPALLADAPDLVDLAEVVKGSDYDAWLRIDAAEARRAAELNRGERVKLHGWAAHRDAIR